MAELTSVQGLIAYCRSYGGSVIAGRIIFHDWRAGQTCFKELVEVHKLKVQITPYSIGVCLNVPSVQGDRDSMISTIQEDEEDDKEWTIQPTRL
jgi:hypothetical protein